MFFCDIINGKDEDAQVYIKFKIAQIWQISLVLIILFSTESFSADITVCTDETVAMSSTPHDSDCDYTDPECPGGKSTSDTNITVTWTAKWSGTSTDAGSFPGGTGKSVQWKSPSTTGGVKKVRRMLCRKASKKY